MPDGIDLKRIINLDPETTVTDDDYTIVDSVNGGAKKFALGQALNDLKDDSSLLDDRVTALEEGGTGSGLTEDIKQALLQIAEKVAYIDEDGQEYYDGLYDALYPPAPPAELVSISAVYTQSGTVYDTASLNSLKNDLVVTALYDDQTTETVTTYTLSGTLTAGTSTITVSYGGKTTTFNVTVTHYEDTSIYNWDFTQSLTDSVGGITATLGSDTAQDSEGVHLTGLTSSCYLGSVFGKNRTIEIDVASLDYKFSSDHGRLVTFGISSTGAGDGIIYRSSGYWTMYLGSWATPSVTYSDKNAFSGKTIKVTCSSDNVWTAYCDGVQFATLTVTSPERSHVSLGTTSGKVFYNAVISGVRIYEGVV